MSPLRQRLLRGAVLLAAFAIISAVRHARGPRDETRVGPERRLEVEQLGIDRLPDRRWRVAGLVRANLVDGARIRVSIRTVEDLVLDTLVCQDGRGLLRLEGQGIVTDGTYTVRASFVLEDQTEPVRRALRYQPRRLDASAELRVTAAEDPARELRPRIRALIRETNGIEDPARLGPILSSAAALEKELWLSTLQPSARRLRASIEAAVRESPFEAAKLRVALVEAEVLSGL